MLKSKQKKIITIRLIETQQQKSYISMIFQTQNCVSDIWIELEFQLLVTAKEERKKLVWKWIEKNCNGKTEIYYWHDVWRIEVVEREERNKEFEVPWSHQFRVQGWIWFLLLKPFAHNKCTFFFVFPFCSLSRCLSKNQTI